jgi:hypothetical protein
MKVRVIEKEGAFYSEYFDETARVPRWEGTFRNNNCVIQNRFKDKEAAIEECKTFAKNNSKGKVVWKDEL